MFHFPPIINAISEAIYQENGKCIIVGGAVRDAFLKMPTSDFDIEVYHIKDFEHLMLLLKPFGKIYQVGKAFGVVKLTPFDNPDIEIDFSFPRKDYKVDSGHRGFDVRYDPNMTYKEAASRRDFTINSIGYDVISHEILDPFNGQVDIKNRILRHIGPAFTEDPLRVLRAVQFSARFDLNIAEETVDLCKQINISELPKERLFEELKKLLLKSKKPAIGFQHLIQLSLIQYFGELQLLIAAEQDPIRHPEGDIWTHTLMVIDEMAQLLEGSDRNDTEKLTLMFAAVCHDLGKPATTEIKDDRITHYGHDEVGVKIAEIFLKRLTDDKKLIKAVCALVSQHSIPYRLYFGLNSPQIASQIKRLALKVPIKNLAVLVQADFCGRKISQDIYTEGKVIADWLCERAKECGVLDGPPIPLIQGRHLEELGIKPGPEMGVILEEAFEAQLDGTYDNLKAGLKWLLYLTRNRN